MANFNNYGINAYLAQVLTPPGPDWPANTPYPGDAKMPFVAEVGWVGACWSMGAHQSQAMAQPPGYPRTAHGSQNDSLNFMFLDGHVELILRDDPIHTGIGVDVKTYVYPGNPNGRFAQWGRYGKFVSIDRIDTVTAMNTYYPGTQ
ncbi:MAG: hypothetical protein PCFJNLEI_02076 [Verrucomicrobiae bacterium]|nr:hypothetical protein [Verrucomicrobiae bacterium]